jgi:hypothetical protein
LKLRLQDSGNSSRTDWLPDEQLPFKHYATAEFGLLGCSLDNEISSTARIVCGIMAQRLR